jgi:hypothetical protein
MFVYLYFLYISIILFDINLTGARGTDLPSPLFFSSNFLFTNLFSIKFLYFFIISSLFVRVTDLPPPLFFRTFCLQIYFQWNFFISLLFHLFFLILTCLCQYSYNLILTTTCMCRPYIDLVNWRWSLKSYQK